MIRSLSKEIKLPNDHARLPKSITDRYTIKKQIGHGGMGNVYLAQDIQLQRDVAIKSIRSEHLNKEEVLKRIDRECKMHAAIGSHPHIVSLFDRIDKEGNIFLVMEYVQGETLAALIKTNKSGSDTKLSPEFIIHIIIQTLEALEAIHGHGIIHRDIKPANIIVGGLDEGTPYAKIMDFGIAKDLEEDDNLTKLTMLESGGPGTPAYMAPERIDSETFGDIVPATDLYAIGIILFELFQKNPPFHGTITEIFSGHLAKTPDMAQLGLVPETIIKIIAKSLEKYPSKRYQTAHEFVNKLKNASSICSDLTLPATAFDLSTLNIGHNQTRYENAIKTPEKQSRRWLIVAAVLLILGAFLTASLFLFPQRDRQNDIEISPEPPQTEPFLPEREPHGEPEIPPDSVPQPLPPKIKSQPDKPPPIDNSEAAAEAFEKRKQEQQREKIEAEKKVRLEAEEREREREEAERLKRYLEGRTNPGEPTMLPPRRGKERREKGDTQYR